MLKSDMNLGCPVSALTVTSQCGTEECTQHVLHGCISETDFPSLHGARKLTHPTAAAFFHLC